MSFFKDEGWPNHHNGGGTKHVKSILGSFELEPLRDLGEFEPIIVRKRQTVLSDELKGKILSLFVQGMSYSDILLHSKDIYGVELSSGMIRKITDQLLPLREDGRSHPLERVYPILFLETIHFKVRKEGGVVSKALYHLLGIDRQGRKQVLGLYVSDSEDANFWCQVLADLKRCRDEDILIACREGLKGFPEESPAHFPQTEVQLCIVHQIRNSTAIGGKQRSESFFKGLERDL